jgi:beta-lactamase superfamily II metal-dependent hydrolase
MANTVRVRMYRPGFGDCFLVSFDEHGERRHVLIDFGAHMHGEIGTLESIMDDIERETDRKLLLVVASHAHRDHISGFGRFADRFAAFQIGEVWLPWTDNPDDPAVAEIQKKHLALYERLDAHLRLALDGSEQDPMYAAALLALSNLRGNEPARAALRKGFGTGATVTYRHAGQARLTIGGFTGLTMEILSPPADKAFLSRMDPPVNQRLLTSPSDASAAMRPFPRLELRSSDADYKAAVQDGQPVVPARELKSLHQLAEVTADRLALVLDDARNNTSLVILFRFHGKSLLFPGDAQWGNWQSWIGTDRARELLSELDFLKVGHHGSHNATPKDVVNALRESGLAVMVSTQVEPFPTIPRLPLLEALQERCAGHVAVRSDWVDVAGAPAGPLPRPPLPDGVSIGALWIDYVL